MSDDENFFKKYIFDPLNESIYGLRQVSKKIGYLEPLDKFFLKNIEDPIIFNLFHKLYNLEIFGKENIPNAGAAIIASNLQSVLDPILSSVAIMHSSGRIPVQLLKSSLGVENLFMNFLRMNQAIFIRSGESDEEGFEKCHEELNNGKLLIYFPEGIIGPGDGKLLHFKSGIIRLAIKA